MQCHQDERRRVGIRAEPCLEFPAPVSLLLTRQKVLRFDRSRACRQCEQGERVVEELGVVRAGLRVVRALQVLEEIVRGELRRIESGSRDGHDQASDVARRLFLVSDV